MEKYIWVSLLVVVLSALCWLLLRFSPGRSKLEKTWPRLYGWVLGTAVLFVGLYFVSPQQAQVVYYKFALVVAAGLLGYWIDRWLFPYARPDSYLQFHWQEGTGEPIGEADYKIVDGYLVVFSLACLRRAIIVVAVILGATLGM